MNAFNKLSMAAAAAVSLAIAAPAAQAATVFNLIDQTVLDDTGTENFGATIDATGLFDHTFDFTVSGLSDASGTVVTLRTSTGLKDLDFTSIDLDGIWFFTPEGGVPGREPGETWNLFTATITNGVHHINVHGNVIKTGTGASAASYGGTLNVTPIGVPEPGTWALMIMGFGGAGALLRNRRRVVA